MEPQNNDLTQPTPAPLKTNPLFVVTPLSKYLALTLFIILPFLGFWLGTLYVQVHSQEVTTVVYQPPIQKVENTPTTQAQIKNSTHYTSKDGVFSINYPAIQVVQPIPDKQIDVMGETATSTYPTDWFEIPNLFIVAKIPYENLSGKDMVGDGRGTIFDYESCCSGTAYSFDSTKKIWSANTFQSDGPIKPKLLSNNGICSLAVTYGKNTFYRIKVGDEGVNPSFHYFLMTDQGYAVRFISKFDLDPNYYAYKYVPDTKPDPKLQAQAVELLASVTLNSPVQAEVVGCK